MFRVFVYGTLKQGHGNHCVMPKGSSFVSRGKYNGKMVTLGGFPGVLKGTEGETKGELWDVPTIHPLDSLEGNGSFYTREEKAISTDEGEEQAWIYLLPKEDYGHLKLVEGGEW